MTDYYKDEQQMTDEQIAELAPDWATHHSSFDGDVIIFESVESYQIYAEGVFYGKKQKSENSDKTPRDVKPIPRKPFDISEHEFSDWYGKYEKVDSSEFSVNFWFLDREHIKLNKNDTIALAKHFKLTAEDLK